MRDPPGIKPEKDQKISTSARRKLTTKWTEKDGAWETKIKLLYDCTPPVL